MAPKTGFSGLVALALLFNTSIVSAVTTASENWKMKSHAASTTVPAGSTVVAASTGAASGAPAAAQNATLDPNAVDCFVTLPNNVLTAQGLSTPFQLMPPCSMTVATQRAFAEAAVFDPATGSISIYHPLIIDFGKTPKIAPVVPTLPAGAVVALWFGFNGATLQMLDTVGGDTNTSPKLKGIGCVNGLPGVKGDVFGQVSWCNTQPFFTAVDASITAGKTVIPPLGTDKNGETCPSSRSFKIADACPSDNLPTQYLLLGDGTTVQDTAANRAAQPAATVLDNASDEALIGHIVDPLIGCTVFQVPSLDDPGAMVGSLATQELQARQFQAAPIANVPMNDPDCLLTASGALSAPKTDAYRLGVNQVPTTQDPGSLTTYCNNLISIAPAFLKLNQAVFAAAKTPDPNVGSTLFTFLCNRYLMSLKMLTCPANPAQPITCQLNGNGAAQSCTINISANATMGAAGGTGAAGATGAKATAAGATSAAGATGAKTTAAGAKTTTAAAAGGAGLGAVGGVGGLGASSFATVASAKSAVVSLCTGAALGTGVLGTGLGAAKGTGATLSAGTSTIKAIGALSTTALLSTTAAAPTCTWTCVPVVEVEISFEQEDTPEIAPPRFGRRSVRRTVERFPLA